MAPPSATTRSAIAFDLNKVAEVWPSILTQTESEWRQLGEEDSPLRRGIERDGFGVW